MVTASVRSSRGAKRKRTPSPISDHRRRGPGTGAGNGRTAATSSAEIAKVSALTPKGNAAATTNNHAPNGLAANWLIRLKLAYSNEFARGRDTGGTTAGTNAADAVS